jgi:acyl-CoA reductase-like NAD-dependent aldehyde dehydrogenase
MISRLQSPQAFTRQVEILKKAESEGKLIHRGEVNERKQKMGFSLVRLNAGGKGEDGALVEEEIFGPVLPIISVKVGICVVEVLYR